MAIRNQGGLTDGERDALRGVLDRIARLARFLVDRPAPNPDDIEAIQGYLAQVKDIQGNSDNAASLVACLLAKRYLARQLGMAPFCVASKAQGAPGLDIDERTASGARVVAEIKTTVPYGSNDLGSAQRTSFEKDFKKLAASLADHRFFFVTDRRTFDIVRRKYATKLRGVIVVLLPEEEMFVA